MGVVKYATGIDYVKGSLAKPKKNSGHKCGDYLIGTHRSAASENPNCTRLYIRAAQTYDRTTPLTTNETAARNRFAAVASAIKARKNDLSKVTADQQAFLAQKDLPGGKKTMQSWYWSVCGAEYDDQHNG